MKRTNAPSFFQPVQEQKTAIQECTLDAYRVHKNWETFHYKWSNKIITVKLKARLYCDLSIGIQEADRNSLEFNQMEEQYFSTIDDAVKSLSKFQYYKNKTQWYTQVNAYCRVEEKNLVAFSNSYNDVKSQVESFDMGEYCIANMSLETINYNWWTRTEMMFLTKDNKMTEHSVICQSDDVSIKKFVSERAAKVAVQESGMNGDYTVLPIVSSTK